MGIYEGNKNYWDISHFNNYIQKQYTHNTINVLLCYFIHPYCVNFIKNIQLIFFFLLKNRAFHIFCDKALKMAFRSHQHFLVYINQIRYFEKNKK